MDSVDLFGVNSAPGGVQCVLEGVGAHSGGPVATRFNFQSANFISSFQDPHGNSNTCLLIQLGSPRLVCLYTFLLLSLVRKVLNKLPKSQGKTLILMAQFWPQKEWLQDLIQATASTACRLPPCQDLYQPHIQHFHKVLHPLPLVLWKMSSDSCITGYCRVIAQYVVKAMPFHYCELPVQMEEISPVV